MTRDRILTFFIKSSTRRFVIGNSQPSLFLRRYFLPHPLFYLTNLCLIHTSQLLTKYRISHTSVPLTPYLLLNTFHFWPISNRERNLFTCTIQLALLKEYQFVPNKRYLTEVIVFIKCRLQQI